MSFEPDERPVADIPPVAVIIACVMGAAIWVFLFPALRWLCLIADALISRIAA